MIPFPVPDLGLLEKVVLGLGWRDLISVITGKMMILLVFLVFIV